MIELTVGNMPDGSPPNYDLLGQSFKLDQYQKCVDLNRLEGNPHQFVLTVDLESLIKYQDIRKILAEAKRGYHEKMIVRLQAALA